MIAADMLPFVCTPVEEPLRHQVEPVFRTGIEQVEPDVAAGVRIRLDDREHQGWHDEGRKDMKRLRQRREAPFAHLNALH